ncbi:hypothetical protein BRADI_1g75075v3 [Brachypodium distachyon]|uniref:Uncharacterized protein n=1 Tax=Brachypodium distachyon TaxID=15368 RepID=A0A2K2DV85_BRADI|nr:hypothetical protein BRADI_1g75075v3 [Brachypodium distachyon]
MSTRCSIPFENGRGIRGTDLLLHYVEKERNRRKSHNHLHLLRNRHCDGCIRVASTCLLSITNRGARS